MKNTTFRKKALLSSVCMLLVALVALGSATFAWFTSSTSATANNIGAKTTKSSELKVAKADLDWQDSIDYNALGKVLRPATSANGENWFKSEAAAKTAFTSNGTYTAVTTAEQANYYYVEMLNIKNAGEAQCKNVTITVDADMPSTFARLAIVPVDAQAEAGKMPSAATNFSANIYGATINDSWKPYDGSAVVSTAYTTVAAADGKEIVVGDMDADEVASYKIIVWFEGEDADCFDTTKSSFAIPSINFSVTGDSAQ